MWSVALCIVALAIICITHWIYSWRNPRCNGRLPQGSMGLPLLGETLEFFAPNTLSDIPPFIKERMESFTEIFGQDSMLSAHNHIHKYIRNLVLSLFGTESLKEKLLPEVEETTLRYLRLWSTHQSTIELKEGTSTGRKKVMKLLKEMFDQRRALPKMFHGDFFDQVIEELKKDETILTEGIVLDLMFALLFASFETTSSALTLAMKFLADHPQVLEELMKEHEGILRNRENVDSRITWEEYKSMTFTSMVINETIRLTNIAPGIFRKAMRDVQIRGYTIPTGWVVMVCPPAVHLNPVIYDDPLAFNPWRWEALELNAGSKNFIAFGGGVRFCVGANLAKLQMAIFLHYLVTKWTMKGGDIIRRPGLVFPNDFHIEIMEKPKRRQRTKMFQ